MFVFFRKKKIYIFYSSVGSALKLETTRLTKISLEIETQIATWFDDKEV